MTETYGFELLRDETIEELDTRARLYRHTATGAELLSLENKDENKVFGITFRTPPKDSTGVAHIMEHSVLCGSAKYPAKEPFIELAKGSLNTFLNAMTYPDKTCYPVASTNVQDLYNLADVYVDAVLHPLITEATFQQEAWHYELDAIDGPLSIKGVVYNEMRGVYSSPDSLLARFSERSLYPDTPYGHDSGGDPEVIPTLTYAQFVEFHRTHYHPTNARIYWYGDDDPAERLRRTAEYLAEYTEPRPAGTEVPLQPPLPAPLREEHAYAVSPEEAGARKGMVTVNWLLEEPRDPELALALNMLEYILVDSPASPLRKALIDSDLGEDLTGGLDNEERQVYFSTGLKGIAVPDAARVEALIDETLARLVAEGIEPEMVEAAVNSAEFSLRENNTGRYPRGLSLMLRALRAWLHGRDPLAPVAFDAPLAAIKAHVAEGNGYFEGLIRQHFLGNTHRTVVVLTPDAGLGERQERQERERLAALQQAMTLEERQAIVENTRALKALQARPDSPAVLALIPSLTLEDLERQAPTIPSAMEEVADTRVLYHDLFTNGIVYLDLAMDLHTLPQELLPYVPLFGQALTEIGTEDEDYVRLSQRIGRQTGGVGASPLASAVRGQPEATAWLVMRGKATMDQADDLLAIIRDVLLKVRLDNPARFRQMVLETRAGQEASLVHGGHAVVNTRLRANYGEGGWLDEQLGGVSNLFFIRQLAQEVDSDWPAVLARLEAVRETLIHRAGMIANVTLDADNWSALRPRFAQFLATLPQGEAARATWTREPTPANEGLIAPTQVNFVGKGADLYALGYEYHGSAAVISHHLRATYIWERVRVQGGAYGGFSIFDHRSGVFTYLSYRDPNLLATLDVYDRTAQFLRNLELPEDELAKTIIGTIGAIDAYMLPDAKGFTAFVRHLVGDTDALRQQRRDEVLGTTLADMRAFADVLDAVAREGRVVVLGSPEAVQAANAAQEGWLQTTRVL